MHRRNALEQGIWLTDGLPYTLRVVLWVFLAAWVALLVHELAHAVTARLLGVRVWSISLGRGPLLWDGIIGHCRIRVALFPLHGEVRLYDADAEAMGYRSLQTPGWWFEWILGSSWRAPLITSSGSVANLLTATAVVWQWMSTPGFLAQSSGLSACIFIVNCMMFLNLMPIRGLDGWRMAVHAAAWRKAVVVVQ